MTQRPPARVPQRRFHGEAMSLLVHSLHMAHEREEDSGAPTLFGYQVPDFQRPNDRWSREQQVRFIESMYLGANIGAFMVNLPATVHRELDNLLLDGLQRLTALKAYFRGEFGVVGEDGVERRWPDLDDRDQAHLLRITFPMIQTRYTSREHAIEAYERHNFGGTPHTEQDRAHLDLIRESACCQNPAKGVRQAVPRPR